GIAPDVAVAALAQIAVDLELAFARWTDATGVERPQRESLRHAVRVAVEIDERGDLIGGEELRILPRERRVHQARRVACETVLEQLLVGAGINDSRAKPANIVNRALDDADAFLVRLCKQFPAHVFAQHAYPHTLEPSGSRIGRVRPGRLAPDAEDGPLVFRVVAGNRIEDARGFLNRSAHRADAHVEARTNHPAGADELFGRRNPDQTVHRRRPAHRDDGFLADRARYKIRGH